MWYVTPILVMLSWIRNMAGVSIISMLGNISVLGGMIAVAAYALKLPPQFSAVPLINVGGFAQVRWTPQAPFLFQSTSMGAAPMSSAVSYWTALVQLLAKIAAMKSFDDLLRRI